jgi:hypothetical protein
MKNKKAISLLETLITITIFLVLLTICGLALSKAITALTHGKAKSSAGTETAKSISWLISDLSQTSGASLLLLDKSNGTLSSSSSFPAEIKSISFLNAMDSSMKIEYTQEFPLIKWKSYIIYFLDPSSGNKCSLYRKTYFNNSTYYKDAFEKYLPIPMKTNDLISLSSPGGTGTSKEKTVARNICNFQVLELSGNICTLKVTAREEGKHKLEVKNTCAFTVVMKNTVKHKI